MAKIIEASAIISAKAGDMSGFGAISKQLAAVSKAGEAVSKSIGSASSGLAKRVEEISGKLRSIDNFKSMSRGLDAASIAMKRAQQDAARLKGALDAAGDGATRKMMADFNRASIAVERATRAFREQGQAVRASRSALAEAGIPVNAIARQQAQLSASLDRTTAAMRRQAEAGRVLARPVPSRPLIDRVAPGGVVQPGVPVRPAPGVPVAEIGGAVGAVAAINGAVMAGADLDSERSQARQAGWTAEEIAQAEAKAHKAAGRYGIAPGSAFNLIRENRQVFGGDLSKTLENIEPFYDLHASMRQKNPGASEDELNRQTGNIVKSAEILGYSGDPKRLLAFADFMVRMSQVHGAGLRGEEILNFAKSSKTAGQGYSFEYLASVLPTTLPELGGDRLGTASMTLRQALVGGKMKKRAAENLADLGVIDRDGLMKTDDDDVKGVRPSSIKGVKLLETNPLKWVQEVLVPAMDAKGIRPEDRPGVLSTLFSDRNGEYLVSLLMSQAQRMEKDAAMVAGAQGRAGVPTMLLDDPYMTAKRVGGAAAQAGQALSEPFLGPLKTAADAAAGALTSLAATARGDQTSTATGVASGGLLGALLGGVASAGSGIFLRGAGILAGGGMGAIGGGLLLPWMTKEFLKSFDPRGPEGSKAFYGSALPGFAGDYDRAWQAQRDRLRDPEAARGRAMLDLSRRTEIEAVKPQEVTAKVEGAATINANVTVSPSPLFLATIDQRIEARGNLTAGNGPGSTGRTMPEAAAPDTGRAMGPR
jgi:hypothetical protein